MADTEHAMVLDIDETNKTFEENSDAELGAEIHSDNTKPKGNKYRIRSRKFILNPTVAALLGQRITSIKDTQW